MFSFACKLAFLKLARSFLYCSFHDSNVFWLYCTSSKVGSCCARRSRRNCSDFSNCRASCVEPFNQENLLLLSQFSHRIQLQLCSP
uniref:Secreted protein n=1 Tax=Arundo donax TaxID=35708 RepID=A0A0A9C7M9_ARUDO